MGVLPYAIWNSKFETDEKRRKKMDLNLLLIVTAKRRILVDTGLGNRLSKKQKEIYQPSEFALPAALGELGFRDVDITDVIMTHLHFDHAGGIVTAFLDKDILTFPNAKYWIQKDEWDIAKKPDSTNLAAYAFEHQLALLEATGDVELIQGEQEIAPGVRCIKTGGHTIGHQAVSVETDDGYYIYAGDIVATKFHSSLAITSAYDVCRADTVESKKMLYSRLRERDGTLLLNHDPKIWEIPFSDLKLR
jgi:glyoxylase-like metal-dependent hydrolase (beta-lactamase superfamily II)